MPDQPRVLIIEDHDVLRAMLFAVLRHQPLAVDTAASMHEAIEKAGGCDYALILIDLNLARDGADRFFEAYKRIRPESNAFIIAVRDPKNDSYIDPNLVSVVLNKPLEIDTLSEVVRECAIMVPKPVDPLPCPPAESEIKDSLDLGLSLPN